MNNALLKKLNIKESMSLCCLNAPTSCRLNLEIFSSEVTVKTDVSAHEGCDAYLIFVQQKKEVIKYVEDLKLQLTRAHAIIWFAYPKKTSKNYSSNITRDSGWEAIGALNYEPVRQVAVDEDWSALRFKHVDDIKNFSRNRNMAISQKGKTRKQ